MRPRSRNRRVEFNAHMKNITKVHKPSPKQRLWGSREEMVIHWATVAVGSRAGPGFVRADDLVSDILLELLDAGGFAWDEEDVRAFCFKRSFFMVRQYLGRRERSACEFTDEHPDADGGSYVSQLMGGRTPARQHTQAYAAQMLTFLDALPEQHRKALLVLCDGGNPIDVADELDVDPPMAIAIIKEARRYIHEVEPDWQDWR
jgi:DNA-directed RNA polymerase specialized sigma24 family protein